MCRSPPPQKIFADSVSLRGRRRLPLSCFSFVLMAEEKVKEVEKEVPPPEFLSPFLHLSEEKAVPSPD